MNIRYRNTKSPFLSHATESTYQKTVLSNGIKVVTEEIPYVRSVSVGLWVNVGSRDEDEKSNGISHFVEHMVFKGTKHFSSQQIARSMESVGGYLNAFTSKENTCFYARALDEHLPHAIEILSDLVQFPLFDATELEKEKYVVVEEIKNIEDDPDDVIHDYFDKRLFPKHSLGFPVIGTANTVSNIKRDDLSNHIKKYYTSQRFVIAVAGNLKHAEVVKLIEKHFQKPKFHNDTKKREQATKRMHTGSQSYEKPIQQAHVCLGTLGYGIKDRNRYPLLILNALLGEGMSSRLFQNIREKYGFAYTIYSFANYLSDTGNFGVYVGTDKKNVQRCLELIHKELDKLVSKPISRTELLRTKEQLKGNMMLSLENMSSRMMRLGSGELYFNDFIPLSEIVRKVDAVNVDQVQEVARKLFKRETFTTVIFNPAENTNAAKTLSN